MGELTELVSVEYPGIVKNLDKMMETLGGIDKLKRTFDDPTSRLELFPRPKDVFSHPLMGDRVNTNNLLVKCIREKVVDSSGTVSYVYKPTIVGIITISYKFKSLADFQFFPMKRTKEPDSPYRYKSIYNEVIPTRSLDCLQSFREDAPLFILPTIFSRFDNPIDYYYKDSPKPRDHRPNDISLIQAFRKPRGILPCNVSWEDPIPLEPHETILKNLKLNQSNQPILADLKACFQTKPIWSRNALLYKIRCSPTELRTLLPSVAYYYPNGPFRCQWVKYGFDPKTNKSSKIYQTLDFRRKQPLLKSDPLESSVGKRQTFDTTPIRKRESLKKNYDNQRSIIDSSFLSVAPGSSKESDKSKEIDYEKLLASFVFTPGVMPPFRQVHYQLNDIKFDTVQKLVHSNDNNEPEVCHVKDGWCGEGVIDQIRCILTLITDKNGNNLGDPPYFGGDSPNHELLEDVYDYTDFYNSSP